MSHVLTLEVPDEVFADLQNGAASLGVEVADYCLLRLKNESRVEDENHPLLQLAGIAEATVPDLAANHDFYLAEEISNRHEK